MIKKITRVSLQEKNKNRSNIYLDGKYFCSLDNFLVLKYKLKPETEIDDEQLVQIQEENEAGAAFDKAVDYISRYRKTKSQLIDYLLKKGYVYSVAYKTVDKLASYGYIDDADYSRSYIELNGRFKGKMLLKNELLRKGVDIKTAEAAVNEIEDETPSAMETALKYLRGKERSRENLAKCYRYLASKGFSFDAISEVMSSLRTGEDDY